MIAAAVAYNITDQIGGDKFDEVKTKIVLFKAGGVTIYRTPYLHSNA